MNELNPTPTPTPYASELLTFLTEQGFRPRLDSEGNVQVQYEGLNFTVMASTGESDVLNIMSPVLSELDNKMQRWQAYEVAAEVMSETKVGRLIVFEHFVAGNVNAYLPDDQAFRKVFLRHLDALKYLMVRFRESFHARLHGEDTSPPY